jgi:hypothetical protein
MTIKHYQGNQGQDVAIIVEKVDFFYQSPQNPDYTIICSNAKEILVKVEFMKLMRDINN